MGERRGGRGKEEEVGEEEVEEEEEGNGSFQMSH